MADLRSLISQIPMEPGYVPAPPEPDLSVIQRLMGLPQTLRAVGQNLAVGAASLPVGVYKGFGNPAAGEAAMSQFQQEYGYTPTNPAAQRQLQGLGEFLQQLETEYKIPPMISPSQLPSRAATAGSAMQLGRVGTRMTGQAQNLARDLVREIQTTPPTGAVTLAPPSIPKSDIGFYSQLESAVQPLQNKGTGQQYLAQIQKTAGVKPEEIQWTGLDTFLQGRQSVTKTEIQDYLNANRVDVQEVRLSDQIDPEDVRAYMEDEAGYGLTYEEALDNLRTGEPSTRFSSYTLPGGENYREILLTLPQKLGSKDDISQRMFGKPYSQLTDQERFQVTPEFQKTMGQDFQSTHFDQPNILAHLRVNDRTVDGKKTLFVEEIQSDWHQAGRKRGYATPEAKERQKEIDLELDELRAKRLVLNDYLSNVERQDKNYMFNEDYLESTRELQDIRNRISALNDEAVQKVGIPDAPFKTSWHELSLKRAIQEAAGKGYDQIAFTTGKTQAERYDLSKQVDSIVYLKENDGTYSLVAIKDGRELVKRDNVAQSALPDLVGKEVADRMAASEGQAIPGGPERELSGENLRVGGEGMKGFYDNILPKSLDKLGKKFGAKVGKTFIEGERTRDADGFPSMYPEKIEVWQMDITPQMRESVTTKGQPLFAIPAIGAGLLGAGMMQEEEQF